MSLTISTDVFCDSPGCMEWVHGTTGTKILAREARRSASRYGWVRSTDHNGRHVDLCPDHRNGPYPKASDG